MPFRDAYRKVGLDIENGIFVPDKNIEHTHQGSAGNLCNDEIELLKQKTIDQFDFSRIDLAKEKMLAKSI